MKYYLSLSCLFCLQFLRASPYHDASGKCLPLVCVSFVRTVTNGVSFRDLKPAQPFVRCARPVINSRGLYDVLCANSLTRSAMSFKRFNASSLYLMSSIGSTFLDGKMMRGTLSALSFSPVAFSSGCALASFACAALLATVKRRHFIEGSLFSL